MVRRWTTKVASRRGLAALGVLTACIVAAVVLLVISPWSDELRPAAAEPEPTTTQPEPMTLRVMSFNIFYGGDELDLSTGDWCTEPTGCQETFAQVIAAIRESGADIVGLQETTMNARPIAEELGWSFNERTHVISRFPIIDPPGADGAYVFVELEPGQVVAMANTHLPSSPYGPYRLRDGATVDRVLALENRLRVPALNEQLAPLEELAADGTPVFLTGDFNTPSHLDWTDAADEAREDIPFPVEWPVSKALTDAGFADSYRVVNPDPVARTGFTWTPGGPESIKREVHDRIDWVLSAGPARVTDSSVAGEDGNPTVDLVVDPWPSDHRGVVSTFEVTPVAMPPLVAVASRLVEKPDPVRVRFHSTGEEGEYVTINDPSFAAPEAPADAVDGTLEFATDDLTPGQLEAALVSANGDVIAASTFWLFEPGTEPTVTTSKRRYVAGEPIEVAWTKAPGMKYDWLSVFKARKGPGPPQENCSAGVCGNGNYLIYEYTGAAINGSTTISSTSEGAGSGWPLEPGRYEIRLLLDDGYRSIATSPVFTIVAP